MKAYTLKKKFMIPFGYQFSPMYKSAKERILFQGPHWPTYSLIFKGANEVDSLTALVHEYFVATK